MRTETHTSTSSLDALSEAKRADICRAVIGGVQEVTGSAAESATLVAASLRIVLEVLCPGATVMVNVGLVLVPTNIATFNPDDVAALADRRRSLFVTGRGKGHAWCVIAPDGFVLEDQIVGVEDETLVVVDPLAFTFEQLAREEGRAWRRPRLTRIWRPLINVARDGVFYIPSCEKTLAIDDVFESDDVRKAATAALIQLQRVVH